MNIKDTQNMIVKELIKPIRKRGVYSIDKDLSIVDYRQETSGQVLIFENDVDFQLYKERNGLTDDAFEDISNGGCAELDETNTFTSSINFFDKTLVSNTDITAVKIQPIIDGDSHIGTKWSFPYLNNSFGKTLIQKPTDEVNFEDRDKLQNISVNGIMKLSKDGVSDINDLIYWSRSIIGKDYFEYTFFNSNQRDLLTVKPIVGNNNCSIEVKGSSNYPYTLTSENSLVTKQHMDLNTTKITNVNHTLNFYQKDFTLPSQHLTSVLLWSNVDISKLMSINFWLQRKDGTWICWTNDDTSSAKNSFSLECPSFAGIGELRVWKIASDDNWTQGKISILYNGEVS